MFGSMPVTAAATHRTLRRLAAIVWYAGVIILLFKSSGLLAAAHANGTPVGWTAVAVLAGLVIGWLKARYLFEAVCIKNLKRIDSLETPRLWQFYRRRFFVFLFLMVALGSWLADKAQGNNPALVSLAVLELSIAMALALSSRCFRR